MTNSDTKSIIAIYLDKLHQIIPFAGSQELVFRGLENKVWGLESSAYLRHADPPTHSEFIQYNFELIAKAKNANYHLKENNKLEEIELLAELRHYGAATALIDFTLDFLVALWFASGSYKTNADGKVVIVNIGDTDVFLQLTLEDKKCSLEEILKFKTREEQGTPSMQRSDMDTPTSEISDQQRAKLWYWQPRFEINHRLSAQKGVFIFGKASIDKTDIQNWEIIISQKDKVAIRRELNDHFGINEDSLFNDLPGFAMVNDRDHIIETRTGDDYFYYAVRHFQRGEFDQAIKYIDKAIELEPDVAVHPSFRGLINHARKRDEDALWDVTKAINLDPDGAAHHYTRGLINHVLENYEDALRDFSKAIELNPENATNYYFRGMINLDIENNEDALKDANKAIELDPNLPVHYSSRGLANYNLEKYDDALKDANKAIELDPDGAVYYSFRGEVYRCLKKYEEALRDATKSIELGPDDAVHYFNRGQVNYDLKRYEDALIDVNEAIELGTEFAERYYFRGLINHELERHEDALRDTTKAIELDPENALNYSFRSQVNRELGKNVDAQRDIDKAKQLRQNSSEHPLRNKLSVQKFLSRK